MFLSSRGLLAVYLVLLSLILTEPCTAYGGDTTDYITKDDHGIDRDIVTLKAYRSLYTTWVDLIARVVLGPMISRRINTGVKGNVISEQQERLPVEPPCRFNTVFKNIGCSFLRSDCYKRGDGTGFICKPSYESGCSCDASSSRRDWKSAFLPPLYMCESKVINTEQLIHDYVFPSSSDKASIAQLKTDSQKLEAVFSHFGSTISRRELKDLFLIRPESWDRHVVRSFPLDIFDLLSLRKDSSMAANQFDIGSFSVDIPIGHCVLNPFFFFGLFMLFILVTVATLKILSLYKRYIQFSHAKQN